MNETIGIILTSEESNMLLKALCDCVGINETEEAHLNAIYRRVVEAQDWAKAFRAPYPGLDV